MKRMAKICRVGVRLVAVVCGAASIVVLKKGTIYTV